MAQIWSREIDMEISERIVDIMGLDLELLEKGHFNHDFGQRKRS